MDSSPLEIVKQYPQEYLRNQFDDFTDKHVVVYGDFMLDEYWQGAVNRISPEAPVPVVNLKNKTYKLGGAANVALNLKTLGAKVSVIGSIGNDDDGKKLIELLENQGISTEFLVTTERPTTVKIRVVSGQHQLLRIDKEETETIDENLQKQILERLSQLPTFHAIIIEDYNKGGVTQPMVGSIINHYKLELGIPVMVDPKLKNLEMYAYVSLLKPNLKEFSVAINKTLDSSTPIKEILDLGLQYKQSYHIDILAITLSERGILWIQDENNWEYVPTVPMIVFDVSGAGDTVIAMLALGMLQNIEPKLNVSLANIAAAIVCKKFGVEPAYIQEVRELCKI